MSICVVEESKTSKIKTDPSRKTSGDRSKVVKNWQIGRVDYSMVGQCQKSRIKVYTSLHVFKQNI